MPTNARGQTYGSNADANAANGGPDLVRAVATNGKEGCVLNSDLQGPMPTSPQQAIEQQQANAGKDRTIPAYQSDGVTQIGVFVLGG